MFPGLHDDRNATLAGLIKRSFSLAGHRTSVALEPEFWDVLHQVAGARGMSLARLVAGVDAARDGGTALASSLRVFALRAARMRIDDGTIRGNE